MSRIGNAPIKIPKGVEVKYNNNIVEVKGPKGNLTQEIQPSIEVNIEDNTVFVKRKSDRPQERAFHGLYRKLIYNMIMGVSEGFTKVLTISGTGYRAQIQGNLLVLQLGFSHPINFPIPKELTITCDTPNRITITGIDKVQVGQVAANIRKFRPPEPYKGKGVMYEGEKIRRKVGKAAK